MVEHRLAKARVAGSNPVSRSIQNIEPRPSGRGFLLGDPRLLLGLGLLFAWMVWGAAPSVFWEDSGNLVASAWLLGVPHPPGEPGWLIPARLLMWLPVGDLAFRGNLLSAICVTATAIPLWWLLKACVSRPGIWAGLFVTAAGLVGHGARLQAVRAEVYGLTILLLLLALAGAVSLQGRRASAVAAAALGLAATVHPLLAIAATPGVAVARWVRSPVRAADVGIAAVVGIAPAGMYALLLVRAHRIPWRSWGVPDGGSSLFDVLLARNFAQNFGGEADVLGNLAILFGQYRQAGVLLLLLLILPALWKRTPAMTALLAATPIWIVGNLATQATQNKVYADNPDLTGYLVPGWLILVPLAAAGLHAAFSDDFPGAVRRPLRLAAAGLALLLVGLQTLDGASADRREDHLPARLATTMSHGLAPGAVLMTSGNNSAFVWAYLDGIERRRTDLLLLHRVLLGHPHEHLRVQRAGRLEASGVAWVPGLRDRPLRHVGDTAPFFLEAREVDLPDAVGLHRHGLVVSSVPPSPATTFAAAATLAEFAARPTLSDPTAALLAAQYREIDALYEASP